MLSTLLTTTLLQALNGPSPASCSSERATAGASQQQEQEGPSARLGSLPPELVMLVLQELAAGWQPLWQDATVPGGRPDVAPVAWPDAATYAQMVESARAAEASRRLTQLGRGCTLQ